MNKFKCPYTKGERDCFIEKCNYKPCDYKDTYQQGKADAIEEFMQIVKENQYILCDKFYKTHWGMFTVGLAQIAEQIKEQTNENK